MQSKRRDLISIVFFGILAMILFLWVPGYGQPPLFSRILLSLGGGLLAWAWLLFNMRHPKYLVRFILFVQAHETKTSILMYAVVIGLLDTIIYVIGLSPTSHFNRIVEWTVIATLTVGGFTWCFLLVRHPRLADAHVPDYAFNIVLTSFVVAAAWFSFSEISVPLVMTGLGVMYLLLIRRFSWIPQFRQLKKESQSQSSESRRG